MYYPQVFDSHDWESLSQKIRRYFSHVKNEIILRIEAIIRGFIVGDSPEKVADELGLIYDSLRTQLTSLYKDIAIIFERTYTRSNFKYLEIQVWAEDYLKKPIIKLREIGQSSVSSETTEVSRVKNLFCQQLELESSDRELTDKEQEGLDKDLKLANSFDLARRYELALKAYIKLLERYNPEFRSVVVQVICVLEKLNRGLNAYSLALFAVNYVENPINLAILYNTLAGFYHDAALANYDEESALQAASYYKIAFDTSNQTDILPPCNDLDLATEMWLLNMTSLFHLNRSILVAKKIFNVINVKDADSNIKLYWSETKEEVIQPLIDKLEAIRSEVDKLSTSIREKFDILLSVLLQL